MRQAGVEAAGHRVFANAFAMVKEETHFDAGCAFCCCCRSPCKRARFAVGAGDQTRGAGITLQCRNADTGHATQRHGGTQQREVGCEFEHRVLVIEQQTKMAGAVVQMLAGQDFCGGQAQRTGQGLNEFRRRILPFQWGRCKGRVAAVLANIDQPYLAFLHHHGGVLGHTTVFQPGVATAQRGVAGKGHLISGGENAHPVVSASGGTLRLGRQQEGGL